MYNIKLRLVYLTPVPAILVFTMSAFLTESRQYILPTQDIQFTYMHTATAKHLQFIVVQRLVSQGPAYSTEDANGGQPPWWQYGEPNTRGWVHRFPPVNKTGIYFTTGTN